MNENTTTCTRDGRPVADGAYCCAACVAQTGDNLKFIEEIADDLETTLTRQDRVSAGTGGRASAETPLPLNLNASEVGTRLRNTLTTWVRLVADDLGTSIEEAFPEPGRTEGPICGGDGSWCTHASCRAMIPMARRITDREMAAWLRKRLKTIAHREWGPQCFDELSKVAVDLGRAVDSPPPMISLGKCDECATELRAHQEATFARCKECRTTYDVARRKDELVARAGHLNMTPTRLAQVISAASGVELKVQNIYNWANRKYLLRRGTDGGKATYSLQVAWELHAKAIRRGILGARIHSVDPTVEYEEAA